MAGEKLMKYYLVAYGHVVRSEKAADETTAMKLAYGLANPDRMTLTTVATKRQLQTVKVRTEIVRKLAVRHFHRTGAVVSGYEKEPGIANYKWYQCNICRKPISIDGKGNDQFDPHTILCQECEEKYQAAGAPTDKSIVQLREALKIAVFHSPCCQ